MVCHYTSTVCRRTVLILTYRSSCSGLADDSDTGLLTLPQFILVMHLASWADAGMPLPDYLGVDDMRILGELAPRRA